MTRPKASGWYHAATKAQTAPDEIPTIACGVESAKQHSHRQHTLLLTCFCTHCVLLHTLCPWLHGCISIRRHEWYTVD